MVLGIQVAGFLFSIFVITPKDNPNLDIVCIVPFKVVRLALSKKRVTVISLKTSVHRFLGFPRGNGPQPSD